MDIVSITGLILIIAIISIMIKEYLPEYSIIINIAAGVIVLTIILSKLVPTISQIEQLLDTAKIPKEYGSILFKCLGICMISQFASDVCMDSGEKALSTKVELAGKVAILATAFPLFEKIAQTAIKLMGG